MPLTVWLHAQVFFVVQKIIVRCLCTSVMQGRGHSRRSKGKSCVLCSVFCKEILSTCDEERGERRVESETWGCVNLMNLSSDLRILKSLNSVNKMATTGCATFMSSKNISHILRHIYICNKQKLNWSYDVNSSSSIFINLYRYSHKFLSWLVFMRSWFWLLILLPDIAE